MLRKHFAGLMPVMLCFTGTCFAQPKTPAILGTRSEKRNPGLCPETNHKPIWEGDR